MKIYQVHHVGGAYEDYFDMIVASFLSKDKAQDYIDKINREKQELGTIAEKCSKCPIWNTTKRKYNKNKDVLDKYCDKRQLVFIGNDVDCENFFFYDDDSWYLIKEEEVIE